MKKTLILAVMLLSCTIASAQKFAHFDLQGTVEALPAYKTAQAELEELAKKYDANLQDMTKEFETKRQKYANEINDKTPQNMVERAQKDLQDMQEKIQQAYEDNQKTFQEERQKKMQPIILRVQDAVNAVAKEGGYVYVIDEQSALGTSIFINKDLSEDVTSKVKAKLGI